MIQDSQDKHKTKSFFTLRGSKDNVSTEPSTMRQAKVSRWKTARKKLNEAAKHSVDAIYQKLKSEEVWRCSCASHKYVLCLMVLAFGNNRFLITRLRAARLT
jgi:hypothetical protein